MKLDQIASDTPSTEKLIVDWDVPISMDDGLTLRGDVFRPVESGEYPVILAYGPYAKGLVFREGFRSRWEKLIDEHPEALEGSSGRYANYENVDPEKWVPEGYVCVRVDSRGTGRSPGYLCLFQARETHDLYECIEWAARQPWSNGKVGLSGISYLAMNQWHVASLQPPHLAAMIAWEGAADFYRDATFHGGIRTTFWDRLVPRAILRTQHGVGERATTNPNTGDLVAGPETLELEELEMNRCDFVEEIRSHPFDDDWHKERSPDWSMIQVPFLSSGNWGGHGLHLRGNIEAFVRAASSQKWLEVHGLEHWTHFYTNYGVALQKEFFEYYLKGVDNGWPNRPRVQLQIRFRDRFEVRGEQEWPIARTRWTRLHLDASDMSLSWDPIAAPSSIQYNPLEEALTFLSPPLEAQTEITGPVSSRVNISSLSTDADLFLILHVFDDSGNEILFEGAQGVPAPIAQGWLRASHRRLDSSLTTEYRPYHVHASVEPLTSGTIYPSDVEVWPTSIVIPQGHRIGLTIQGVDYVTGSVVGSENVGPILHDDPRDRPPDVYGAPVTLHCGGNNDSYVLLPVIPPETRSSHDGRGTR